MSPLTGLGHSVGIRIDLRRVPLGEDATKSRSACVLASIPLLLLLISCGGHPTDATPSPTAGAASPSEAQLFTVPQEQMAHVEGVAVQKTRWNRFLRLTGSVTYNNFETTPVISQVGGPVARILVLPGETAHAGQPMLAVSSPDYAQARTNFLKARDANALALKAYQRADDLYAHHAIAGVEANEKLPTVSPEISVLAPIGGEPAALARRFATS